MSLQHILDDIEDAERELKRAQRIHTVALIGSVAFFTIPVTLGVLALILWNGNLAGISALWLVIGGFFYAMMINLSDVFRNRGDAEANLRRCRREHRDYLLRQTP